MPKRKAKTTTMDIIAIIDRSGSMGILQQSTIDGFNGFLKEQQSLEGKASLTLVLFDRDGFGDEDDIQFLYRSQDIQLVAPLNRKTYVPRGSTPLYDAIGKTLTGFKGTGADKTVVLVITDGYENASLEYDQNAVRRLIESRKGQGWEFIFLGANVEKDMAYRMGFSPGSTYTYLPTMDSTDAVYANVTRGMSMTRSGINLNVSDGINEEELLSR